MGFGKRKPGAWVAKSDAGAARVRPRHRLVATALVGLLIGFGTISATTMVRASERGLLNELFETIFGAASPPPATIAKPGPKAPRRYASLPDTRRIAGPRFVQRTPRLEARSTPGRARARVASPASFAAGTRTVCMRRCDGYVFPLGRLHARADLPVHAAACAAACPNAPTEVFTLAPGRAELEQSVALDGRPYLRAATANLYRRTRVENCSCQPSGAAALLMPLADDRTLRPGDVVASEEGADLVAGLSRTGPALVDYRIAALSRPHRNAIEDRVGALRRDAAKAAFREALQAKGSGARRLQVAEAQIPTLPTVGASAGFAPVVSRGEGFAAVRMVSPSPFGH
ncbi:hypothetical protein Y590_14025 [Methylobacterium sp. AMS5]|nr:hypothetical protein Y590_14025 [Methylobacterium sp. AMS5]